MISLISVTKAQDIITQNVVKRRLILELTQSQLAVQSGVPLSTLRKFEQTGLISLEALLKLLFVLGGLEEITQALKPPAPVFKSMDDVLKSDQPPLRKRGRRK